MCVSGRCSLIPHIELLVQICISFSITNLLYLSAQPFQLRTRRTLVDDAAVGHIEDLLQQGMLIANLLRMMTAVDIGVDARHRSRTEQRGNGDQVLDTVGLQAHKDVAHALALKLEHALGGAA